MLWTTLDRYRDLGLLIARLGFGLGFVWYHGLPKITGGPERWAALGASMGNFGIAFAPEWWGLAAALAETLGALMFAAGFLFRPAVLALMVVMIVATVNHIATGVGTPAHSFKNIWIFAGFFLIGPGRYSVDHLITANRGQSATPRQPGPVPERGAGTPTV